MIDVRKSLLRQVRNFFDTELCGLFNWNSILIHQPEEAPPGPRPRRKHYREMVTIEFGGYEMSVAAPFEEPPLGWIKVTSKDGGGVCQGPLDRQVWMAAGKFVREHVHG